MLTLRRTIAVLFLIAFAGCGPEIAGDIDDAGPAPDDGGSPPSTASVEDGAVSLTAENTNITWIGTKPDGRHTGEFEQFTGTIEVGEDAAPESLSVEIETESITSDAEKLTNHLKTADFFDVRKHPQASFQSTAIEPGDQENWYNITGDLTLHGETKSIAFPAEIKRDGDSFTLAAEFKIDRFDFGMTYGEGKVDKEVTIKVEVGK